MDQNILQLTFTSLPCTRIESCKRSKKTIKSQGMRYYSSSKDDLTHGCSHNEDGNNFGGPKLHGTLHHVLSSITNSRNMQVLQASLNRIIAKT